MIKLFFLILIYINLYSLNLSIDIGHNKKNYGSQSSNCTGEFEYNKDISINLKKYLDENGIKTKISKNVSGSDTTFKERKLNSLNQDLYLSIHHDSVQESDLIKNGNCFETNKAKGFSILVSKKNKEYEKSLFFARILGAYLLKEGLEINNYHNLNIKGEGKVFIDEKYGIYEYNDLLVLKGSESPAVLLECGVILNKEEEKLVKSIEFKNKINRSVLNSLKYYENYLKK